MTKFIIIMPVLWMVLLLGSYWQTSGELMLTNSSKHYSKVRFLFLFLWPQHAGRLLKIFKSDNYREEISLFILFTKHFISQLSPSYSSVTTTKLGFGCRHPCTASSAAHMWVYWLSHTSSWALLPHKTKGVTVLRTPQLYNFLDSPFPLQGEKK